MKVSLLVSSCLIAGCALAPRRLPPYSTSVWVRSHNGSAVDVYLLCGSADARRLGTVAVKGSEAYEIAAGRAQRCPVGLKFFLVVRSRRRGHWVGPFWPQRSDAVRLVIEKYAGLSSAELVSNAR